MDRTGPQQVKHPRRGRAQLSSVWLFRIVLALGILSAPGALAQSECVTGVDDLCQISDDVRASDYFGEYGDIVLLALGLFVAILVVTIIIWLIRKASEGPRIKVEPRTESAELEPAGSAQIVIDVENLRKNTSTDVDLVVGELPPGWSVQSYAGIALPAGFTQPVVVSEDRPLHLTSAERGGHEAALAIELNAPPDVNDEQTFELKADVVPVVHGVRRTGREKSFRFPVFLNPLAGGRQEVIGVTHEPESIVAGRPVKTRAVVANHAEGPAENVPVNFLLNDEVMDRKVVPTLQPHHQATVEFDWVAGHGENRIRIHLG